MSSVPTGVKDIPVIGSDAAAAYDSASQKPTRNTTESLMGKALPAEFVVGWIKYEATLFPTLGPAYGTDPYKLLPSLPCSSLVIMPRN